MAILGIPGTPYSIIDQNVYEFPIRFKRTTLVGFTWSKWCEWGSGLTYLYLCQIFSYPLKFCRKTGIRFRTFAQTIDRLTPSSNRS